MSSSENYGSKYFRIILQKNDLWIMADSIVIDASGCLCAYGGFRKNNKEEPEKKDMLLSLAPGQWKQAYAASCLDGRMVCRDEG